MASAQGEPDSVVYDLMRCGIFKTGQEVITDVLATETPPLKAEHVQLLDKAAQDIAEQRSAGGFQLRMRSPEGTVAEFVFEFEDTGQPDTGSRRPPDG
jgi:hypothetical protein